MLSVQKKGDLSLKNFCIKILNKWPEILDHTNPKLQYQKKEYLSGFYIENFFQISQSLFIDFFLKLN